MANVWQSVQYPQVASPVGDTTLWTEPIVPDETPGWFQPVYQPVLAVEYRYVLPSLFYQGDPAGFVEPSAADEESAWFQPIYQPVLGLEYRYLLPYAFTHLNPDDFIEPIPEQAVWFQPTYQPVLAIEYRHLLPSHFAEIDETDYLEPDLVPTWHFTHTPVLAVEHRYMMQVFFTWYDISVGQPGILVELRPRTLETYMPDRTLEVTLREGGRETI